MELFEALDDETDVEESLRGESRRSLKSKSTRRRCSFSLSSSSSSSSATFRATTTPHPLQLRRGCLWVVIYLLHVTQPAFTTTSSPPRAPRQLPHPAQWTPVHRAPARLYASASARTQPTPSTPQPAPHHTAPTQPHPSVRQLHPISMRASARQPHASEHTSSTPSTRTIPRLVLPHSPFQPAASRSRTLAYASSRTPAGALRLDIQEHAHGSARAHANRRLVHAPRRPTTALMTARCDGCPYA
ncbi:hypothetical protein PLICRDRAFT_178401 [Plicaturopsis crispa FD-325 SS-3]|nr:hypothetical protein PLICRDRAFT_178401 [Plicaturopsis crispa FD-325 SS-3]